MDQPGSPARGQLNRENAHISLSPFAPENLVSRDGFGSSPVYQTERAFEMKTKIQKKMVGRIVFIRTALVQQQPGK